MTRVGDEFSAGDEQRLRERIAAHGEMNIPAFKKPTKTQGTCSGTDGPRFSTHEALKEFNEKGILDDTQMVPGHPINNNFLNPLINPVEVDNNELMNSAVSKKSRSTLGHVTTAVARGLVTQRDTTHAGNVQNFESPYSVENPWLAKGLIIAYVSEKRA
jgi:hypothetical protein